MLQRCLQLAVAVRIFQREIERANYCPSKIIKERPLNEYKLSNLTFTSFIGHHWISRTDQSVCTCEAGFNTCDHWKMATSQDVSRGWTYQLQSCQICAGMLAG